MDMNSSSILYGTLFSAIGMGFFVYGKKQQAIMPFVSGVGLLVVPYLITSVPIMVVACAGLIVLPFVLRR